MSEPMTPERLDEIKERAGAATGGKWHAADSIAPKILVYAWVAREGDERPEALYLGECYADAKGQGRRNMKFIAHAREDVPDLVAEVERLTARVNELETARDALMPPAKCQ